MRPLPALSFLLSTQFISAAPVPRQFPVCQRFRSCAAALAANFMPGDSPPNPYLPPLHVSSAFEGPTIGGQGQVEGQLTSPDEDPCSRVLDSSTYTYSASLVDAMAQYPVQNWRSQPQDAQNSEANSGMRALLWCQQMKQFSWRGLRESSVLLLPIVSLVIFFLIALMAWEVVKRSGRL